MKIRNSKLLFLDALCFIVILLASFLKREGIISFVASIIIGGVALTLLLVLLFVTERKNNFDVKNKKMLALRIVATAFVLLDVLLGITKVIPDIVYSVSLMIIVALFFVLQWVIEKDKKVN